jgi:hypothetical protein
MPMRAPVYRHIESASTLGGLGLGGFIALLGFAFLAIQSLDGLTAVVCIAGLYVAMRLAMVGRPPGYWQHRVVWELRRRVAAGRLSAAARARSPAFPFAVGGP